MRLLRNNCQELAIIKTREQYANLREYYIEEFEFMIPLLQDAEEMNRIKVMFKGETFLRWTDEHSTSLRALEKILKYLKDNEVYWNYKLVIAVINSIPTEQQEFKDFKKLIQ